MAKRKAGYCNKCRKNVWLRDDDGCEFGHDPSSISHTYKAEETSAQEQNGHQKSSLFPTLNKINGESKRLSTNQRNAVIVISIVVLSMCVVSMLLIDADSQQKSLHEDAPTIDKKDDVEPTVSIHSSTKEDWATMTQEQRKTIVIEYMNEFEEGVLVDAELVVTATKPLLGSAPSLKAAISEAYESVKGPTVDIDISTKEDWQKMTEEQKVSLAVDYMNKYKGGQKFDAAALTATVNKLIEYSTTVKSAMDSAYYRLETETHEANISKVAFGMSTAQVQELVGEPDDKQVMQSTYGNTEYWYYDFGGKNYQICFSDGVVDAINQY